MSYAIDSKRTLIERYAAGRRHVVDRCTDPTAVAIEAFGPKGARRWPASSYGAMAYALGVYHESVAASVATVDEIIAHVRDATIAMLPHIPPDVVASEVQFDDDLPFESVARSAEGQQTEPRSMPVSAAALHVIKPILDDVSPYVYVFALVLDAVGAPPMADERETTLLMFNASSAPMFHLIGP